MRTSKYSDNTVCVSKAYPIRSPQQFKTTRPKFNASSERKIERVWLDANKLGWSYNDFVAHLLEVLVIIQFRDKLKRMPASKLKLGG